VVGGEESYGYMIGDFVRDKDAIASVAMLCEMAAYAKQQGQSLYQMLMEMYQQHGYYLEHLISITKKGMNGAAEIKQMMADLRGNPPAEINGQKVVKMLDYQSGEGKDFSSGEKLQTGMPKSNVLQFWLADGSKISARPSGTEPKIKFYFSVNTQMASVADAEDTKKKLMSRIDAIMADMELV
jgi:phosphoglucomutase